MKHAFALNQAVRARILTGVNAATIHVIGFEGEFIVCENRYGVRGHFRADELVAV
ncbi:hypothetical protein H1O16_gp020 [Burkholderia phage BcepSaruman]|uniref:Uncharacterized protein n=1 Tax=Burkholderia phage BcepSaruman TaxID=2530032 RepID=A0A4D5ZBR4_9CAUD|nr:hypothetical protein H1O16_gp020 [Burkholderia phage BcepSaruman]QBX06433.1 hypothetical protein BcepSaruman_020 [Burkholderia phage BcepSaruman]